MFAAPEGMLPGGAPTPGGAKRGTAGPSSRNLKSCNCRNSRCLKLYCECFASGQYCFACNCQGCHNNPENDEKRKKAIAQTLERNPQAFRPKIKAGEETAMKHAKGCHCKKSGCLKKYCECFQAGIQCTEHCKCIDCKNRAGMPGAASGLAPAGAAASPLPAPKRQKTASATAGFASAASAATAGSSGLTPAGLDQGVSPSAPGASGAAAVSGPAPTITRTVGAIAEDDISAPLKRARAAIAETISEDMCADLVRDALSQNESLSKQRQNQTSGDDGDNDDGAAAFQQQEHHVLSLVHAALHKALAAARAPPPQPLQPLAAAAGPSDGGSSSTAAGKQPMQLQHPPVPLHALYPHNTYPAAGVLHPGSLAALHPGQMPGQLVPLPHAAPQLPPGQMPPFAAAAFQQGSSNGAATGYHIAELD